MDAPSRAEGKSDADVREYFADDVHVAAPVP
jgi:hypothetical protein